MSSSAAIPPAATRNRRFRLPLRFSLRTFLAAITILCVALGWRINRARLQRDAVAAIHAAGGFVHYDYQQPGSQADSGDWDAQARPWEPVRLQALVGIDFFHDVTDVSICTPPSPVNIAPQLAQFPRLRSLWVRGVRFDDASLRTAGRLARLEFLVLRSDTITDDGVAHLSGLPRLRHLDIRQAQLGDPSLRSLAKLPNLEFLEIEGNRLTDSGLAVLAGHPKLKCLRIGAMPQGARSSISDAGVVHLTRVPHLEEIGLQYSRVTPAGLRPLTRLPNLRVLSLHLSLADDSAAVTPLFPRCEVHCNH